MVTSITRMPSRGPGKTPSFVGPDPNRTASCVQWGDLTWWGSRHSIGTDKQQMGGPRDGPHTTPHRGRIMAQETIVFAQGIEMPPHIQALAQSLKPAEFALRALPSTAKPEEIAAAMRDAEYLVGFLRFLPDEAYLWRQAAQARAGPERRLRRRQHRRGPQGPYPDLPERRRQLRGRVRARRAADPGCLPEDRGLPSERGRRTLAHGHPPHRRRPGARGKDRGHRGSRQHRREDGPPSAGVRLHPRLLRHRPAQRRGGAEAGRALRPLRDLAPKPPTW